MHRLVDCMFAPSDRNFCGSVVLFAAIDCNRHLDIFDKETANTTILCMISVCNWSSEVEGNGHRHRWKSKYSERGKMSLFMSMDHEGMGRRLRGLTWR
jgi:hypothetical protein